MSDCALPCKTTQTQTKLLHEDKGVDTMIDITFSSKIHEITGDIILGYEEYVPIISFSIFSGDILGQVFTMLILTVAAAEAAIGLAILVCFYRLRNSIFIEDANTMKG